ncbi:MAG: glycine cleavage system H-protein subunit [Peltula sp. TS41687]|nr:MAG: glycine cleavage system H-protein subunit [Peltula sp. TS41687]
MASSIAKTGRHRALRYFSNAVHSPSFQRPRIHALPRLPALAAPRIPTTQRDFSVSSRVYEKKYTPEHEWIDLPAGSKTATIGITTYAAEQLGDVVFVELPNLEQDVKKGDSIGAVESVKSASDIMTPASGKVVQRNDKLEEKPGLINKSPEGDGWIAKLDVLDEEELRVGEGGVMDEKGYKEYVEGLS